MKKQLIIIVLILTAVLFAGLGVNYLLSLRKVNFSLAESTAKISIYTEDDEKKAELSSDGQLLLQSGNYYVIPEGEDLTSDKIEFTVEDRDATVTINPPYTDEFLAEEVEKELGAIETAIAGKYPEVFNDYTLAQGSLYEQGQWYGGLLKPKVSDIRDQKDPYRVVLQKKDGAWMVIRRPEYVLTSSRYEEVPVNVLKEINLIVGVPGN